MDHASLTADCVVMYTAEAVYATDGTRAWAMLSCRHVVWRAWGMRCVPGISCLHPLPRCGPSGPQGGPTRWRVLAYLHVSCIEPGEIIRGVFHPSYQVSSFTSSSILMTSSSWPKSKFESRKDPSEEWSLNSIVDHVLPVLHVLDYLDKICLAALKRVFFISH